MLAVLGTLSTNIILPGFAAIGSELGMPMRDLAQTLSAFFITFALGQLVVGPLSHRFGRRWFVIGELITFRVGNLLCAAAPTLPLLMLGRVMHALGACRRARPFRACRRSAR